MQTRSVPETDIVKRIVAEHRARPGPLLEILHAIQDELGYIPGGAVPVVAEGLNLSRAEVHGVVTFYHHFRGARARVSGSIFMKPRPTDTSPWNPSIVWVTAPAHQPS